MASSVIVLVVGGFVLVAVIADVPLARLAHQSLNSSGGSSPVWFSAAAGAVGFVVASRKPRNPLGWFLLVGAALSALSQDASFYVVAVELAVLLFPMAGRRRRAGGGSCGSSSPQGPSTQLPARRENAGCS